MRLLNLLFFLSGAAGLMYEVVWARLLADALGSTALSITVVFSVFLLALATGALVVGRGAAGTPHGLRLYGWLEIGVGVLAAVATAVLLGAEARIAVASPGPERFLASAGYAFAVAALLIGPPALLMGGTLPAVLEAARRWDLPHRAVARLYGWNTLGAAVGTGAAGFVLIWWIGLTRTVGVAVAINLCIGVGVLAWTHGSRAVPAGKPQVPDRPRTPAPADVEEAHAAEPSSRTRPAAGRPSPVTPGPTWWLLAFLSGFTVLAYEILWGRLARFLLGDRTLAVTALLVAFITALGAASFLADRISDRRGAADAPPVLRLIGTALLFSAALHVGAVALADGTIQGAGLAGLQSLTTPVVGRVAAVLLLILPPVLALGAVFPLLAKGARGLDERPGRVVGELYFVNTVGAVLGALTAVFLLSRGVGTYGGFIVLTAASALIGWAVLAGTGSTRAPASGALAAVLVLLVFVPRELTYVRPEETVVLANEDEYGVQVMVTTDWGTTRVRNNRLSLIFDLGHPQTAHAQQMAAHLTALLARNAETVLNVGTGYGITAGAYTLYPDVRSVRTVEILPFLVAQQRRFRDHNFDYLRDERVSLLQGDGRHELAASDATYDIISVNVLDPYLPGSSSLYTVDFWELVRSRLRPGGAFTQLFWGEDLGLLVRGLEAVFPTVLYFPAYGGTSYNVVAFQARLDRPPPVYLDRLAPGAVEALRQVTGAEPEALIPELVARAWTRRAEMAARARRASGPLHTDDRPILEYRWAHGVEGVSVFDSPLVQY